MNMHVVLETALVAVIAFLLLSQPRIEPGEHAEVAGQDLDFNYFMEYYPGSKVQGYFVSKEAVQKDIEGIREDCGPAFEEKDYWKFDYSGVRHNRSLTVWVDIETREMVCMVDNSMNADVRVPFGANQTGKEIRARSGDDIAENIVFYNINGDDTYYIKVSIMEKPDWEIRFDPPLQIYRAAEKDPVEMNIKMEPSDLFIVRPAKYPPTEDYVEMEGIEGIVRVKYVNMKIFKPELPKEVNESQTHRIVLNVTASYYRGMRVYEYGSKLLNYTVVLEKK